MCGIDVKEIESLAGLSFKLHKQRQNLSNKGCK